MDETIRIELNGKEHEVRRGATLADLLASLEFQPAQVAVERNRELVPRARHTQTVLRAGDAIEVVTLVGGG